MAEKKSGCGCGCIESNRAGKKPAKGRKTGKKTK